MIVSSEMIKKLLDIWPAIVLRMNERRITPELLAYKTGYSLKRIREGIAGTPAQITEDFLRKCVIAFGLLDGRKSDGKGADTLSFDECVKLIKPTPAMPPRKGNFWDYDDES